MRSTDFILFRVLPTSIPDSVNKDERGTLLGNLQVTLNRHTCLSVCWELVHSVCVYLCKHTCACAFLCGQRSTLGLGVICEEPPTLFF